MRFINRSLTTKLLCIYVPILTVCVVSMFAVLELTRTFARVEIEKDSLERLVVSQNAGIARALWEYDIDYVEAIVQDLAANPDFQQAIIREPDGRVVLKRPLVSEPRVSLFLDDQQSIEEELSLLVNGEMVTVGTLTLTYHFGNIERQLIDNLKQDALIVVILGCIIVIVTIATMRIVVGTPLKELQSSIELIRDDGVARNIEWSARDEIGHLVDAFNDLQAAQAEAERALRKHRDELEETVAARTRELAENEAFLSSAFENMPDGFFIVDGDGRLSKFNKNYADNVRRLAGEQVELQTGMPFEEVLLPMAELGLYGDGLPEEEVAKRMESYRSDEPAQRMIEGQTGDVFQIRKAPIGNGISVNIMVDLTEMRRAQDKLLEAEERFRFSMDSVGAQFWIIDMATTGIEFSSTSLFDRLGYSENEFPVTQEAYATLIHPDDQPYVSTAMRDYVKGQRDTFEIEYRMRDGLRGGWRWLLSRGKVLDQDSIGRFSKISGITLDINDIKRKSELLNSVLGSMNQGIAAFDEDLRLAVRNQRFLDIRDYPETLAVEGVAFEELMRFDAARNEFGEGDPEDVVKERVAVVKRFRRHSFERTRPDGTIIEVSGGPLPSGGFVSTYTDVTERRLAEQRLADAYAVISSSIEYAARIQRSVLPTETQLSMLLPTHYVLWEPRDVVGGDLYWVRLWGTGTLVGLGDCTGHGVPGAFMTLIATSALDQAMKQVTPGHPAALLQRMHQLVQNTLGRSNEGVESNDGLEIGLCYFDPSIEALKFSGARFSLFRIVDDVEGVEEIKGDKTGIGYPDIDHVIEFSETVIIYGDDESFHMVSDGMIDQVGGERRRAFGKKRYIRALEKAAGGSFPDITDRLRDTLTAYQGSERRRDDVSAIGFVPSSE